MKTDQTSTFYVARTSSKTALKKSLLLFVLAILLVPNIGSSKKLREIDQTGKTTFFMTSNDLKNFCNGNDFQQGICFGFIVGVNDLGVNTSFCTPTNVTAGQLRDIVIKFLNDNPAELHKPAVANAMFALRNVFPCNRY